MTRETATALRVWLFPLSILLGVAFTLFALTCLGDALSTANPWRLLQLLAHPDPQSAATTLANAGQIVSSVLAIAITVVAIVVELASNRYTHRVTALFVGEPINFFVMGLFVVTTLQGIWVTMTFDDVARAGSFIPHVGISVTMILLTVCLVILLPYFNFVFAFLNPIQIVRRISKHTLGSIQALGGSHDVSACQEEAVRGIEQLADVALNSMEHKDKGVSMASVDALRQLAVDYQTIRANLPEPWFRIDGELAHNPDFVSMTPEVLEEVAQRRIWFEMKVLRQYQTIYSEALNRMRDINYLLAINTRILAKAAIAQNNDQLLRLVIKFFNTYLRTTINHKDVRTAYNVLNQYRLLAEELLAYEGGQYAAEIASYFKYYGQISYSANLPFILETVAYDLCALNEMAFDNKSEIADRIMRIFLMVDKESEGEVQEASLRGVRKAQIKLATYLLVKGDKVRARTIYQDMENEAPTRIGSIRDELLAVQSQDFWEISDRGVNFDYLSVDRKSTLKHFFSWFANLTPPGNATFTQTPGPLEGCEKE
jgi:PAS domain-containing protein